MVDLDSLAPERIRLIRRVEYDRLVELGLFEDERIELLGGVIVEMTKPGTRHSESVNRANAGGAGRILRTTARSGDRARR